MKKILTILLVSFVIVCAYLLFADPYGLTPLEFLPLIASVYVFSALAIYVFLRYFSELKESQRRLVSVVLGFSPTILCALMTLGKVAAIDVVLAITVPALIAWYGIRVKQNQR